MNHDRMKFFALSLSLWISLCLPASAEEEHMDGNDRGRPAIGVRTGQWLAIQREGRAAGKLLPIPGAEAGRSYQRYMDSFAHPVDEQSRAQTPSTTGQK